ncbi:MAG: metallophosphoesterase [Phycisphaerae bacterium]
MREPRIDIHRLDVPIIDLAPDLEGFRIVHVTDLHFRRWTPTAEALRALLLTLDYELIAVTGDLGTSRRQWPKTVEMTRAFFLPLARRTPVFGVLGNHDWSRLPSDADFPLTILENERVIIDHGAATLELVGIDQRRGGVENVGVALGDRRRGDCTVLMAHYPSTVYRLPTRRVDLQLSGHTHGGQIRLPWLGCVWANDRIARRMARGMHRVLDTTLHVSAGIGASPPFPARVNCPSEITVLTLGGIPSALRSVRDQPDREKEMALAAR